MSAEIAEPVTDDIVSVTGWGREFRSLRAELDPRAVFVSDLSRRLSI